MPGRITEAAEGIYRINLDQPAPSVSIKVYCYLLDTGKGLILVDSGWKATARALVETIRDEFGSSVKIETLLITHLHPDHYGGARAIAAAFAPRVVYHRAENIITQKASYLAWVSRLGVPDDVFAYISARAGARLAEMPLADAYLRGGATIVTPSGRWSVVHTPGHTAGHVCLFRAEDRVMVSGDHLLPDETSNVGYYPIRDYNPLKLYLENLVKVASLVPSLVLPSHGRLFRGAGKRVAELFDHHKVRLRQVFDGLERRPLSPTAAAGVIRWSRGSFESLVGFNRWLAITETLSHLEFLRWAGVARRIDEPRLLYEIRTGKWSTVERIVNRLSRNP